MKLVFRGVLLASLAFWAVGCSNNPSTGGSASKDYGAHAVPKGEQKPGKPGPSAQPLPPPPPLVKPKGPGS
jgi:hypothetical protein